jgi:hypothetical protein
VALDIVTCPQWNAKQPKHPLKMVHQSVRIIFHHTAGHARQISQPKDESLGEAIRYAQDLQEYHMHVNGWVDSGHNFLVCRNGVVLQGRWLTVSAIEAGHMVESAHCPKQNDQIGIEHEHLGTEEMTPAQREASAVLQAWIAHQYHRALVLPVFPHKKYYDTSCPANLVHDIPKIRQMAQVILKKEM